MHRLLGSLLLAAGIALGTAAAEAHPHVWITARSEVVYASDGSNYRQAPIGVVVPRDNNDVIAAMTVCRKFGAPVFGRRLEDP